MTNDQPRFAVYCWFDTEYTDLDYNRAEFLQVALVVTDETLRPIGNKPSGIPRELLTQDGFRACIKPPPRSRISQHVLENYQDLLERCAGDGYELTEVDTYLTLYVDQFPESKSKKIRNRPVLAGNSIHADFFLVRKFLPGFAKRLNYRLLDVSSQKLEWRNYFRGEKFRKKGNPELIQRYYLGKDRVKGDKHDAYYDVQASIAELAYYRAYLKKTSKQ
jgi:oligoribonuclease (3'-5' exoribonuclease)